MPRAPVLAVYVSVGGKAEGNREGRQTTGAPRGSCWYFA